MGDGGRPAPGPWSWPRSGGRPLDANFL